MLWAPAKFNILAGGRASAAADNFITRAMAADSSLDAAHRYLYKTYLNGLTADGLFKSDGLTDYYDCLWVLAAQVSGVARLNLVSSSYTCSVTGSPTFTADRGYTGTTVSPAADYLDTGFNPSTASGLFTQNSAHCSAWCNTNSSIDAPMMGVIDLSAPTRSMFINPRGHGGGADSFAIRVNDGSPSATVTNTNALGHYLANRNSSTTEQGYKNAADQSFTSVTSAGLSNLNCFICANNDSGGGANGRAAQVCMASIGGSLTSSQVTAFYNRSRIYMTAVGVP